MKDRKSGTEKNRCARQYFNPSERFTSRRAAQLLFVLVFAIGVAAAQSNKPVIQGAAAQPLTNALIALNQRYQAAPPAAKAQLLVQLQALAAKRQQLMLKLMETDPGQVLLFALPASMRAGFPPQVQTAIEQGQQAAGVLQVLMEDRTDGAQLHYGLQTAAERLSLHFARNAPTNLLSGTQVRVKGVRVGNALALACCSSSTTASSSLQVISTALPNTFGAQNTLVILVNFQDNASQPYTTSAAQNVVFTTASNFWLENSFQQTWLTGDVAGWFTLPLMVGTTCPYATIQSYANTAAQNAGYVLSNYQRFVYAFPQISGCSWWGLSYIGGSPSSSWVNGNLQLQVVDHELGHALGLYHSHALNCGSAAYAASGCTQYEYGDYYDIMGNSFPMHYTSFQKERLGWLNYSSQPLITAVINSGSYNIAPYETQDSHPKALKIVQSSTSSGTTYYYVESRQAIGFDSLLSNNLLGFSNVLNGVVVHLASPSNANGSDLLNMNPSSSWGTAMALDVGQSYSDSTAGITISPISASSTGATVQVTLAGGTPTCTPVNPLVSISPLQSQAATAGTTVSFTISVTDNDSSGCGSANFNLAGSVPSGWSAALSSSMLTLTPGSSGSATFQVTSPTGTAGGLYNVGVSAINAAASYTASAAATYVVATPTTTSISVSTNQSTYSSQQTVYVTVTVLAGSSPDAGASVAVNITNPSGSVAGLGGTTGSNGTVTLNYRLKRNAPAGTYQVQAGISASGSSAGIGASTSFTVQ